MSKARCDESSIVSAVLVSRFIERVAQLTHFTGISLGRA